MCGRCGRNLGHTSQTSQEDKQWGESRRYCRRDFLLDDFPLSRLCRSLADSHLDFTYTSPLPESKPSQAKPPEAPPRWDRKTSLCACISSTQLSVQVVCRVMPCELSGWETNHSTNRPSLDIPPTSIVRPSFQPSVSLPTQMRSCTGAPLHPPNAPQTRLTVHVIFNATFPHTFQS